MSTEAGLAASEAGKGRLWGDGLKQRGDKLAEKPPGGGTGQAAAAKRGESSNSSTSGSSRRISKR